MEAKQGAIAVCSLGQKGLITSAGPVEVTYEDGTKGLAWTGIHMGPNRIGKPWSSRKPKVLQHTRPVQYKVLCALLARAQRQKGITQ